MQANLQQQLQLQHQILLREEMSPRAISPSSIHTPSTHLQQPPLPRSRAQSYISQVVKRRRSPSNIQLFPSGTSNANNQIITPNAITAANPDIIADIENINYANQLHHQVFTTTPRDATPKQTNKINHPQLFSTAEFQPLPQQQQLNQASSQPQKQQQQPQQMPFQLQQQSSQQQSNMVSLTVDTCPTRRRRPQAPCSGTIYIQPSQSQHSQQPHASIVSSNSRQVKPLLDLNAKMYGNRKGMSQALIQSPVYDTIVWKGTSPLMSGRDSTLNNKRIQLASPQSLHPIESPNSMTTTTTTLQQILLPKRDQPSSQNTQNNQSLHLQTCDSVVAGTSTPVSTVQQQQTNIQTIATIETKKSNRPLFTALNRNTKIDINATNTQITDRGNSIPISTKNPRQERSFTVSSRDKEKLDSQASTIGCYFRSNFSNLFENTTTTTMNNFSTIQNNTSNQLTTNISNTIGCMSNTNNTTNNCRMVLPNNSNTNSSNHTSNSITPINQTQTIPSRFRSTSNERKQHQQSQQQQQRSGSRRTTPVIATGLLLHRRSQLEILSMQSPSSQIYSSPTNTHLTFQSPTSNQLLILAPPAPSSTSSSNTTSTVTTPLGQTMRMRVYKQPQQLQQQEPQQQQQQCFQLQQQIPKQQSQHQEQIPFPNSVGPVLFGSGTTSVTTTTPCILLNKKTSLAVQQPQQLGDSFLFNKQTMQQINSQVNAPIWQPTPPAQELIVKIDSKVSQPEESRKNSNQINSAQSVSLVQSFGVAPVRALQSHQNSNHTKNADNNLNHQQLKPIITHSAVPSLAHLPGTSNNKITTFKTQNNNNNNNNNNKNSGVEITSEEKIDTNFTAEFCESPIMSLANLAASNLSNNNLNQFVAAGVWEEFKDNDEDIYKQSSDSIDVNGLNSLQSPVPYYDISDQKYLNKQRNQQEHQLKNENNQESPYLQINPILQSSNLSQRMLALHRANQRRESPMKQQPRNFDELPYKTHNLTSEQDEYMCKSLKESKRYSRYQHEKSIVINFDFDDQVVQQSSTSSFQKS